MKIGDQDWDFTVQPGSAYIWRGRIEAARLPAVARAVQEEGGQLVALWGSDDRRLGGVYAIHVAFLTGSGLVWVAAALPEEAASYPDLAHIFPQADRMQRATFDLLGIAASGAADQRKWLRHSAWAAHEFPLRKDFISHASPHAPSAAAVPIEGTVGRGPSLLAGVRIPASGAPPYCSHPPPHDAYPFIRVEGDGVHEIAVGPIHAGTIEPGHFRFSIIGDKVLKLEERMGYTHKGVEKRFEGMDIDTGAKFAGRVSGDSHTAFAWAYCMAVEAATGTEVPERALWLRALFLELERIANHLGDLGYLANDAALTFGFMQFWRLKEDLLRLCRKLFGHRYLYDRIVPGGMTVDLTAAGAEELLAWSVGLEKEVRELKAIYDEHAGLQDRFANTGIVKPDMAARLGLTGLAGRASAQAWDARAQFPQPPYDQLDVNMATHRHGDVLARAEVRFAEVYESLRLIREILAHLPAGAIHRPLAPVQSVCEGMGWVEGWRGGVVVAVRIGVDGLLDRVHPHDPSWQNWPLLEVGVLGNIVPDFPLINKSFNLSYSGQDL